jgi:plasmid stabilization system protein ParE
MKVRFHEEADVEFREAILWYEHQRRGLGLEFVLCVDEAIERIRRTPEMYPTIHKSFRRIVVRRFPFALFCEIVSTELRVLAVFHSRRDPARWKSRE